MVNPVRSSHEKVAEQVLDLLAAGRVQAAASVILPSLAEYKGCELPSRLEFALAALVEADLLEQCE